MRILHLCSKLYWTRKLPRTRFHAIEALGRIAEVHNSGPGFDDWNENKSVSFNLNFMPFRPEWIVCYKPDQYDWTTCRIPVCQTFNDCWATEDRKLDIQLPDTKLVIMHHANEMDEWQERFPKVRFVNVPYPINPEVFRDYGLPKTIDVLLTGAVDKDIYPLRYRFKRMIEAGMFAPYKAVYRPHPGYRLEDPEAEAVEYAKLLNSARICLADTSRYVYAAEKYHEIPACRSVLCGNMPAERQHELNRFMLTVHSEDRDEVIADNIKTLLDTESSLSVLASAAKAELGHDYVHSQFTTAHYARRLLEAMESC